MYSVLDYGLMLADSRADLYAEALRRVVRPGAVVVDLGAGTGVWAALACRLGARRVFAIEPADVIGLAIDVARSNGLADRITFIQRESVDVRLDEPADVVVADVRGILPFLGSSLQTMIDARRFLSPGGVLIPSRDELFVAAVHAPAAYRSRVQPWEERTFGVDSSRIRHASVSSWGKSQFRAEDLLSEAGQWAVLDYNRLADPSVAGDIRLIVTQSGLAHGFAVWFDSVLVDEIQLRNTPGAPPLIYGQAYFPWPAPVELTAGDVIDVRIQAAFTGTEYLIRWRTDVRAGADGPVRAEFSQSTFDGIPLSLEALTRQSAGTVVAPGPERAIEQFVLDAFDGVTSQGAIADLLVKKFPGRFEKPGEALSRVAAIGTRISAERGSVGGE